MNHFLLIPLFAAIANIALGFFVFTRDVRLRINQVFLAWGLALGTWNIGAFYLFAVTTPDSALAWARITFIGVIFLPAIFFHLCALLTRAKYNRVIPAIYAVTLLFAASDFTPFFVKGVRRVAYGWFSIAGPGFWAFSNAFYPLVVLPALLILILKVRSSPPHERRKYLTLVLASSMLVAFGTHDLFPVLGFDYYPGTRVTIYPWGTFAASLYGVLVGYGVLHDQLLDMRVSLGRQAATALRLAFLLATVYILMTVVALVLPFAFTLSSFIAALCTIAIGAWITGAFFPRLLGAQSERLERKILGDRFEYQEQVRDFISSVSLYSEPAKMLDDTVTLLHGTMKLSSVGIVVLDVRRHEIQFQSRRPRVPEPWADDLGSDSPLFDYFRTTGAAYLDCRNPQLTVFSRGTEKAARASMSAHAPELIFRIGGHEMPFGALIVSRKIGDGPVTNFDMELLLELSRQLGFTLDRIRLAEQSTLTERYELLHDFSKGLAHDLNGQLTPIKFFLQLIEKKQPAIESDLWDLHRMAMRSVSTMSAYIQEAAFFANSYQLNTVPLTLRKLLLEVQETTEARAKNASVNLEIVTTAGPEEERFFGDRILLQRMIANLVANSVDASAPGQTVTIKGHLMPGIRKGPDWIRIQVIDKGSGIAAGDMERIFDPYFSTKTTGDEMRGFGLGLTITQKVVHLHNGRITIKSDMGHGTVAQVDLPIDPEAAGAVDQQRA
jgi:signal transduction histidine kinase